MKNLIKLIALIFCAGFIFVTCQKAENKKVTAENQKLIQSSNQTSLKTETWGLNWMLEVENGVTCIPTPLDCYDEIVITPSQTTALQHFENAVQGNAGDVQYFFTYDSWDVLFPGLDGTTNLDSLRTGHYDMVMTHNDNNIYFYGAGNSKPLNFENEEFVLRIDKNH